ncbi:MAG: deoxyribonuclease IV, partial [Erysipelotrichaceae bacterium]|nr:deoxyribonuclease IV [Erysipelotrichaceae bacterium]
MVRIGSHVGMKAPEYLLGAVKEALSYNATALMLYTGAPQNTKRKPIEELLPVEAKALMEEKGISRDAMVIHAPYIINLGNSVKPDTYQLAKDFLKQELERVESIGASYLVLHPGSAVGAEESVAIEYIINGLNEVLKEDTKVTICLETMAGKGSEMGRSFEQLKLIREGVIFKDKIGFCLDTCHIHDAGYDLLKLDEVLEEFNQVLGLEHLKVIHVNDSKNVRGARKDRHANIGQGEIGVDTLRKVVHHPLLANCIFILETPWIGDKAPYKEEIQMLLK